MAVSANQRFDFSGDFRVSRASYLFCDAKSGFSHWKTSNLSLTLSPANSPPPLMFTPPTDSPHSSSLS